MLRILKDWKQVEEARKILREKGCDTSRGWRRALFTTLFTIRYRSSPPPVAMNKSWDVLMMLDHVQQFHPNRESVIYDMGSFNSEIPLALWSAGYGRIYAADLDRRGVSVNWYGNLIRFRNEDYYRSSLPSGSLDVITSLSTIEHGYDPKRLFAMAQRLLKPGGTICITTDYHEPKIEIPASFTVFGLPYQVFSRRDIGVLLDQALYWGFEPTGGEEWVDSTYPIEWLETPITFVFVGLRKVREMQLTCPGL